MSTYAFSSLGDEQHLVFDPDADVLNFDSTSISAAGVQLASVNGNLSLTYSGKTVWLDGMSMTQISVSPVNVKFANGSVLAIGDGTSNPLADYYGQSYSYGNSTVGNQVWGLGGADSVTTGSGADWIVGNDALTPLNHVSRNGSAGSPSTSEHASISADGRFVGFEGAGPASAASLTGSGAMSSSRT